MSIRKTTIVETKLHPLSTGIRGQNAYRSVGICSIPWFCCV